MNKDTRTFIWGMILLAVGAGCFYLDLKLVDTRTTFWNVVNIAVDFYFMWIGVKKIEKTTD